MFELRISSDSVPAPVLLKIVELLAAVPMQTKNVSVGELRAVQRGVEAVALAVDPLAPVVNPTPAGERKPRKSRTSTAATGTGAAAPAFDFTEVTPGNDEVIDLTGKQDEKSAKKGAAAPVPDGIQVAGPGETAKTQTVTLDQVKKLMTAFMESAGADAMTQAQAVLKEFGISNLKQLKPEQYDAMAQRLITA